MTTKANVWLRSHLTLHVNVKSASSDSYSFYVIVWPWLRRFRSDSQHSNKTSASVSHYSL